MSGTGSIVGSSRLSPKQLPGYKSDKSKFKMCDWCSGRRKVLRCSWTTDHGVKEFCSETCLSQYKKSSVNEVCTMCQNVSSSMQIFSYGGCNRAFCNKSCLTAFRRNVVDKERKRSADKSIAQFSWETYLKETDSFTAPVDCFKQFPEPKDNKFKINMKLEAPDPRNLTSICIATVVGVFGPRLKLRLDGSDDRNDFWMMSDSADLHPVGYCESTGGLLQPPLGFRSNPSSWPSFLVKLLDGAIRAPSDCFLDEPPAPQSGLLQIGMKLEAVDKKQPHLICPATIAALSQEIYITFDGWRGAPDYWCSYDNRDLFPVGWCEKAGLPLQPPGQYARNNYKSSPTATSTLSPPSKHIKVEPLSIATAASPTTTMSPSSTSHSKDWKSKDKGLLMISSAEADTSSDVEVTAYVNYTCYCGPHLMKKKVYEMKSKYGPGTVADVLRDLVQGMISASFEQRTLAAFIKTGSGRSVVTANIVNTTHTPGQDPVSVNLLTNLNLPDLNKTSKFWKYINKLLERLGACSNLLSPSLSKKGCQRKCNVRGGEELKCRKTELSKSQSSFQRPVGFVEVDQCVREYGSPGAWTVDQVSRFLNHVDSALNSADSFKRHEIDGKALLLLTSELMIKYMDMKLGPALKVASLISTLKSYEAPL